ncbi:MAG TPA: hypothetical protein VGP92_14570 [Acidimicrobiia bacterium]|nr:hypothetical protein [Acidimicrobiia bacterium]
MNGRRAYCTAATTLFAVMLAACGSSAHPSTTPVTVFNMTVDPGRGLPTVKRGNHATIRTAVLRSTLNSLLSKHATLVAELVHEVGAGQANTTAAVNALAANTHSLTDAIAFVYGVDGARAFAQLWEQHTQFFIDLAQAVRSHDSTAKDAAESKLHDYQNDFASFVTTATDGGVNLVTVTALLHTHVQDMTTYIEADVAGHTSEAAQALAHAVSHMHVVARAISDAIVAQHLDTVSP